jgi:tetratricopeptide (TPR) repeat protein
MAIEPERDLDPTEAASLLWPEASPGNARAYLRRAVMELRAAGLELVSTEGGLSIAQARVTSDFEDAAVSGVLGTAGEKLAPHWEFPMLDEIRRLVRTRVRKAGVAAPPPEASGDAFVLALLGDALIRHAPEQALALVAAHRYDFYTKAPEPDLLRFLQRLRQAVPQASADKVAVMCVMAGISAIQTQYHAADELYREAIRDAEALGEHALLARALAMRFGVQFELRDWAAAKDSVDRAIVAAERGGQAADIAFALNARASYLSHTGSYDEAIASYQAAIAHAEPGPHRDIPRHNLAFVWGVLGGAMADPPAMVEEPPYAGTHLPGGQAYEFFSLGIGHRRYRDAARGAAGALSLAAEGGMERLVAINLDNAAIAFVKLGHPGEAAACVRLGTRLRFLLGHRRSRMEYDALRRHVNARYFGPGAREWVEDWRSPDPHTTAYRVAARLRLAAS